MISYEFLVTAMIVVIAPGTGVIYTLAIGLGRGRAAAIAAAFGCTLGIVPHILAATLGFAALLHTSALVYQVFKYAGALYLVWLAIQVWRDRGTMRVSPDTKPQSLWRTARTGMLINVLNPKLSIFFLAFLPQFVPANSTNELAQMLTLSALFMLMTFVVFVAYGLFAAVARTYVLTREPVLRWFRIITAGAFGAMGARLALSEQN